MAGDQRHFLDKCVDLYKDKSKKSIVTDLSSPVAKEAGTGKGREGEISVPTETGSRKFRYGEDRVPEGYYRSCVSARDVEVRIIDHAHSLPSEDSDDSYRYGVQSLIDVLESIEMSVRENGHSAPNPDLGPALEAGFCN